MLAIPGGITLLLLLYTRSRFPNPEQFEPEPKEYIPFRMKKSFILYIAGISLFAFGFIDYSLIVMHISRTAALSGAAGLITEETLPLLYRDDVLPAHAGIDGECFDSPLSQILDLVFH